MTYPYPVPAVVGVEIYKADVVVARASGRANKTPPERGEVREFSKASRRRLAFVACNTDIVFTSMCTLTYPREYPNDGDDVKRDLRAFLKSIKRKTPNAVYLWFLEFQKRGAPHVHLLLRGVRVNWDMQHWVSQRWYDICGTGDIRHLRAGTRLERIRKPNGGRNYAVKYASKMYQKHVPEGYRNVGRFWGCSRCVKPILRSVHRCTNDDLIGALDAAGWHWIKGETVRYKVLFGASDKLTKWINGDILELSSSGMGTLSPTLREGKG